MEHGGIKFNNYKITGDDTLLDEQNHITPEIRRIIEQLRPDLEKGRKYLIKRLNRLCLKYPQTPTFKNFLSTVYQKVGKTDKAYAVNHWIVKEHPDYLFGKINLAVEYLFKNQPQKVPAILGERMEISELYPQREEFHMEEVIGFHTVGVQYFLAIDEIEQAEMRVELLEDLAADHPKTHYAKQILQNWYITKAATRREKELEQQKKVILKDTRSHLQTTQSPQFHFPEEIKWLYENNLSLNREKITEILQLKTPDIIEDLEKVLQDSIARFDFFVELVREEGYANQNLDSPIHALLLLADFKSEKSLPQILQLLSQNKDFTNFWFGDFIGPIMENALYHCGRNQVQILFDFLGLPNIHAINKAVVGESLLKIIEDSDGERAAFTANYRQVLNLYIENAENENFADTEAVGFLVSDITDLGYEELLPEISRLFDLKLVDSFIAGSYSEVQTHISSPPYAKNMEFIRKDIYEKYEELHKDERETETQEGDGDFFSRMYEEEMLDRALFDAEANEPVSKPKKIGRNDPCPCGSGKKYKKCCLNK